MSITFGVIVAIISIILTIPARRILKWLRKPTLWYDILCWLRKQDTSKPTNLEISEVTCDSVLLEWTKPANGSKWITSYTVLCRCEEDTPNQWHIKVTSTIEKANISGLDPKTTYVFKVRPECDSKYIVESDCSDPVETKPKVPGKPDRRPFAKQVKESSILLRWHKPAYGAYLVKEYQVLYTEAKASSTEWKKTVVQGDKQVALVDGLEPETRYIFKVCPVGDCGSGPESDPSDQILTDKRLSKRIKEQAKQITSEEALIDEYELPMKPVTDKAGSIARHVLGTYSKSTEKVLMLVGETGSGKTTLLNAIANYVCGVHLEDNFRFKLNVDKGSGNQAESQTSLVTAYTFCPMDGSPISYTLTIIDTPGFNDPGGITRDREIIAQMAEFFSKEGEHMICHLNAVGIVLQAAAIRLTLSQQYVFDSVLSMFGEDAGSKMLLLVTFADGEKPKVLNAVKKAMPQVPFDKVFKFNNSSLFPESTDDEFAAMFWKLSMENCHKVLAELEKTDPIDISLTREVLEKRVRLETLLNGLQNTISEGLDKISELDNAENALKVHKEDMLINENFTYKVKVSKRQLIKNRLNQKALNCRFCLQTCSYPCELVDNQGSESATCNSCQPSCPWENHYLHDFHYETSETTAERTQTQLMKRFNIAQDNFNRSQLLIQRLQEELSRMQQDVMAKVQEALQCQQRLNDIALKPGKLNEATYIDQLIEVETRQGMDGYLERIAALKQLKQAAILLTRLISKGMQPAEEDMKTWWTEFRREN